jgi:hypothetical protein
MPSLGDAFVDVRANTAGFERDLNQGVTKGAQGATGEMGKLGKATKNVGAIAKVALAGAAVGALAGVARFAQDSIRAYSDLNESINAVNVSFGSNADEVQKLGQAAARNLGLSNSEFNTLSVSISAFTDKIAADLGLSVPEVLDTLTTRIADFASVMNLEVSEGFEKFRSGLAGESEPLRKFGIDVSAATVEQTALAAGIIEVGDEMTASQKVTARYLTIMEQTEKVAGDFANTSTDLANAQRIAAAEMENAKARVGEALVPFAQLTTQVKLLGAQTLGLLATGFAQLTGKLNSAQSAVQRFEITTGASSDTLQALITVNQTYGTSLEDLAETLILTADESEPLTQSQKDFLTQIGYTAEEVEQLDRILANEHAEALAEQEAQLAANELGMVLLEDGTMGLAEETEELTREIVTNAERLKNRQDQLRAQFDPMFALTEATRDQAAAQEAVNALIDAGKTGTPEYILAVEDLSKANLDLKEATEDVRVNTDLTREAFIRQQTELGLTREQAELLADQFNALEAFKFTDKSIRINEVLGTQISSNIGGRAGGGPMSPNIPYVTGELGPEIVVPRVSSTVIPNNQISTGLTVGSISVSISGGATQADANMVADAIEERLERLSRARVVR